MESLERRELMSASPWHTTDGGSDEVEAIAVGSLTPGAQTANAQSSSLSASSRFAIVQFPPIEVTREGSVLKIRVTKGEHQVRVYEDGPNLRIVTKLELGHGQFLDRYVSRSGITSIEYHGTDGRDTFVNETGLSSTAYGYAGNDTMLGGRVTDIFYGGSGNDHLNGRNGQDKLYGGKNGSVPIGSGAGRLGDELFGGEGNDTLDGGAGDDWLYGHGENDTIYGRKGNDYIDGGSGNDTLLGGIGNDTIIAKDGVRGNDTIDGGPGNNVVVDDAPLRLLRASLAGKEAVVSFNERSGSIAAATFKANEAYSGGGNATLANKTPTTATANGSAVDDTMFRDAGVDSLYSDTDKGAIRSGNDITGNNSLSGALEDMFQALGARKAKK